MTTIKIVQVIAEIDGQLCHVRVPAGTDDLLASVLQANPDGTIHAVKLPADFKMVPLKDVMS